MKTLDITGQQYGLLTVLEKVPDEENTDKYKKAQWKCKCVCGNECIVSLTHLRSGHTKSCGCWKRKITQETNKKIHSKINSYDLTGEFGIGYTDNVDPTDKDGVRNYFYFDLEDYDKIKDYHWYFNKYGYVEAYKKGTIKRSFLKLHRLVMQVKKRNVIIDHIKHLLYDNRKSELRICNQTQNAQNSKSQKSTKTGHKGVSICNKKFQSYITINKKRKYLGTFDTLEEAVAARKKAEDKYFGEFSYDNSMKLKTS